MKKMNFFKMRCDRCKKEIRKKPIKEAVKSKEWWKQEIKDFGWGNLLILIAIILVFSGFYFEYGDKVQNPCEWCKIRASDQSGEDYKISCSTLSERANENPLLIDKIVGRFEQNGTIEDIYP